MLQHYNLLYRMYSYKGQIKNSHVLVVTTGPCKTQNSLLILIVVSAAKLGTKLNIWDQTVH